MSPSPVRTRSAAELKPTKARANAKRWLLPAALAALVLGYALSQYRPAPELPEQVVLEVHGLH